jgi:hypothetical protein
LYLSKAVGCISMSHQYQFKLTLNLLHLVSTDIYLVDEIYCGSTTRKIKLIIQVSTLQRHLLRFLLD